MNLEDIQLGFRMIAQGRPQQDAAQRLAEALAVVLADPEQRLAQNVVDEMPAVGMVGVPADVPAPTRPRGGRPK